VTWKTATTPRTDYFLNSVFFRTRDIGWCAGYHGIVLKTVNSGTSWSEQTSGSTSDLYSLYFCKPDTGFAVGYNGTILRTNTGGTSWFPQVSGTTSTLQTVFFVDTLNGWCGGDNGVLLRTSNGGISWEKQSSVVYNTVRGIRFINLSTGYAACDYGQILKTTNGGTTWDLVPSGTANQLFSVWFTDSKTGWFVGSYGTILKTTSGGSAVSVPVAARRIPEEMRLEQNYPNPFNPTTTIRFSLATESAVDVEVYTSIGQKVRDLVHEVKAAGTYDVPFSGAALSSGVYFYTLRAAASDGSGSFTNVKKLQLIK
jgi:photosystem II stability/assembly factor-like uncharacterized protein